MVKVCPYCGRLKPLSDFTPRKDGSHGVANFCKACRAIRDKAQQIKNTVRIIEAAYDAGAEGKLSREEYVKEVLYGKDS